MYTLGEIGVDVGAAYPVALIRERRDRVQARVQAYRPEQARDRFVPESEQDGQRGDGYERRVIDEASHRRDDDAVETHDGQARELESGQQIMAVARRAADAVVFAVQTVRGERERGQQTVERQPERPAGVRHESQDLHRSSDGVVVCGGAKAKRVFRPKKRI